MENIFNMLQPGGNILLIYSAHHPIFDVFLKLANLEHWKPYIQEPRKYVAAHQYVHNVEESLHSLLQELGFISITCHCKRRTFVYENIHTYIGKY